MFLKSRGQVASTYIETWTDEEGVQQFQPTMGWAAFTRFCYELVFEFEIASEHLSQVVGEPSMECREGAPDPSIPPLQKIRRRGPYPSKVARDERISKLYTFFVAKFFEELEEWRRCDMGEAPGIGQVYLQDVTKTGRYLVLYVRAKRDIPLVVIRYRTLRRVLILDINVSPGAFLERVSHEFRGKFKRRIKEVHRFTNGFSIDGVGMEEAAVIAEAMGKLIREGAISLPPCPE
jgi:hypothetical protein